MLRYFKYRIPFNNPFKYAGNQVTHREGIIISFNDEDGIEAYGEVAPLPGFSKESLQQVEQVLKVNKEYLNKSILNGDGRETIQLLQQIHKFPSLSFGLDTLFYDLEAKRKNVSLLKYLFPDYDSKIYANSVVGLNAKEETLHQVQRITEIGFKTIKVKVGHNIDHEIMNLEAVRAAYPDLNIRTDVNQAWNEKEAIENLSRLESLDIEYCEQPIPAGNIRSFKRVSDSTKIPIAADESVRNIQDIKELSEAEAAKILILKPMMIGAFSNYYVTKEISNTHINDMVYTTSLETAVGRAATVALAAGLGSTKFAHGLATGALLIHDIVNENWLDQPEIIFPDSPGIGVNPKLHRLTEF